MPKERMKTVKPMEFTLNVPLEEAWVALINHWKENKVKTEVPIAQDLPDGSGRFMRVHQGMSFSSNGQDYEITLRPTQGGTQVYLECWLAFGYGAQWAKPLTDIKKFAKNCGGANEKIKFGKSFKKMVLDQL
ncbi:MAG: hypothetical protein ACFFCS_18480 [Candidatus Hodarchaeota archaeon]